MQEQTAVITGGTGNLGSVVTRRFLEEGAAVLVPWRSEGGWHKLRDGLPEDLNERLTGFQADLTDEDQVQDVMHAAAEQSGSIYALLNLAGAFAFGSNVWETDLETWTRMMEVNLRTAFLCCKHALPAMLERGAGRIVNVSSKAAVDVQAGAAAYAVAKSGILTLTRAMREELKGTGVSVYALMPAIIDTPTTRRIMPEGDHNRWVSPERIADVLLALCGDRMEAAGGTVVRVFGRL
ncbi:MAG: SDR family NAD(P)-dependent oxidoreductase [Candidatus Brocadiia bacterium]